MARGGFRDGGFRGGLRDGGFRGGFREGGFHRGFDRDRGFRRFGWGGFYPYDDYGYYDYGYPDYGYPDYAYGDSYYGNGGDCHVVQRRVHSRSGWHYRSVQVCG
jgi:hypothetical protein